MNTKNIFRTLLMVVLLLVGANSMKADEINMWNGTFDQNNSIQVLAGDWNSEVATGCKIRVAVFNRHIHFVGGWGGAITFEGIPLGNVGFTSDSYYDAKLSEESIKELQTWYSNQYGQRLKIEVDNYMSVDQLALVDVNGTVKENLSNTPVTDSSVEISSDKLSTLTYGDAIRIYASFNDGVDDAGSIRFYYNEGDKFFKDEEWISVSKEDALRGYVEIEIEEADVDNLKNASATFMVDHDRKGIGITQILLITGGDDLQTPKHTLTIDIDGQETTKSVAEGADLSGVLPTPTKTGYTFTGWSGLPEDGKMPAEDWTVTAQFTINSYTLTYMIDGVQYGGSETYEYGATITPRGEPTYDGYTFSGWNGLPTTMPDHDVTVTGSYIKNREYVPAVVSSHGWSTFSSTRPLDFSGVSGVKAYIATRVVTGGDDDVVELVQVTGTCAAGTGLVLNGSAGTYQIPVATTNGEDYNNNLLVAVTSEATINSGNYYVLTYQNNRVAFASTAGSSAATIPAGHACLRWSQGSNARALKVVVAGETTGINAVENALTGNEVIYNLRGQRVVNPGKGVYIINGKKVVLK